MRAKTAEEVRTEFLSALRGLANYWAGVKPDDALGACNGLAFSICSMLDGVSGLPAFDLVLSPHQDDKNYCIENGEDWYEPGMVINDCMLHELYYQKG